MTNDNISSWGLLGPEQVPSARRTRTLEVASAVRIFNDLAVPGMGGVWYGKQLMLSLMGVAVAGRLGGRSRVRNIEMANAIEALACCLALRANHWQAHPRLRGRRKMYGAGELLFSTLRKPSFYVTQPMRMATLQPLRALGLVEAAGERFNAFRITAAGEEFLRIACDGEPVLKRLVAWVEDRAAWGASRAMAQLLSPMVPLGPRAREYLGDLLAHAGAGSGRRAAGLAWVGRPAEAGAPVDWENRPAMIAEDHWRDLQAGALFFLARDTALQTLDALEQCMGSTTLARFPLGSPLPEVLGDQVGNLRRAASRFLQLAHDPSDGIATKLCRELSIGDDAGVLGALVTRDARVLRLDKGVVLPGPAYRGAFADRSAAQDAALEEDEPPPPPDDAAWPPGISRRIANLHLMHLDLSGKLVPDPAGVA